MIRGSESSQYKDCFVYSRIHLNHNSHWGLIFVSCFPFKDPKHPVFHPLAELNKTHKLTDNYYHMARHKGKDFGSKWPGNNGEWKKTRITEVLATWCTRLHTYEAWRQVQRNKKVVPKSPSPCRVCEIKLTI